MKRVLVAAAALLVFAAEPAAAEVVTEPDVFQGSLTENYRGTKVTASYSAFGSTYEWVDADGNPTVVYDPLARYAATIRKGGRGAATVWAHSVGRLDEMIASFGYRLSVAQVAELEELAASYTCSA